jgi:Family of unknown function (DUF6263)
MKSALLIGSLLLLATGAGPQTLAKPVPVEAKVPQVATALTPQVDLLTVGAEPRQALRFQPKVQAKQLATMTMKLDMVLSLAGKSLPANKIPATVMKFETTVTQVDPNGDIYYQFRYTDVQMQGNSDLPAASLRQLRSQIEKIKGLSGTVIVDQQGQTKSANFATPANADAMTRQMVSQMSQSIDQFSAPVPIPAVGIGAKWRVTSTPQLNGIRFNQTATYELVNRQNGIASIKVNLGQQADQQPINAPGLSPGSMTLKSLRGNGQGQIKLKFDRMIPLSAEMSVRSNSTMESANPSTGKPMVIGTDTKMNLTLVSQ